MGFPYADLSDDNGKTYAAPRLVGWKDIASYLGKADRTVKRWGSERGLPVYRVPGAAKTSVYAYTPELDRWLESVGTAEQDAKPELEGESEVVDTTIPVVETASSSAPQPFNLPVELPAQLHCAAWNSKRAWAAWLAAAVVLAVAFDIAARLTVGASAASAAHRIAGVIFPHNPSSAADATPSVSSEEKGEANNFYLRGRYEWNQRTPESLNLALDLFTQAIVRDPGDARAYAGLADTYNLLREYSTAKDNDAFPRAIAAARKAVALDNSLPEAHRALAFAEMYGPWDFSDADREFRLAIALNPNDSQARLWYANALDMLGRFPAALEQMDKAQELDPSSRSILADKGLMLYRSGRAQEGLELLKEVEHSAPDFRSPHFYLMRIDFDLHDYPGFLAEGQRAAQDSNDAVLKDIVASAAAGYAHGGDHGLLNALYIKQKEYHQAGKLHVAPLAITCALLGKKQEALSVLEEAYKEHDIETLAVLSHPCLLTLRNDPRYQALIRRVSDLQRSSISPAQSLAAM